MALQCNRLLDEERFKANIGNAEAESKDLWLCCRVVQYVASFLLRTHVSESVSSLQSSRRQKHAACSVWSIGRFKVYFSNFSVWAGDETEVTALNVGLSTNTRHWEKTGLSVSSTELLRRFEVRTALKMQIQNFWFVTLSKFDDCECWSFCSKRRLSVTLPLSLTTQNTWILSWMPVGKLDRFPQCFVLLPFTAISISHLLFHHRFAIIKFGQSVFAEQMDRKWRNLISRQFLCLRCLSVYPYHMLLQVRQACFGAVM